MDIFPSAEEMAVGPLFFMLIVYGFVLYNGSKIMAEGSEMLLLIYGPGIIGGLIIPILGAVPDCMIILLSGLGDREQVQEELSVGVGTLVGSTVMLLTIPWSLGVYLGRRTYDDKTKEAGKTASNKPRYDGFSWTENCVTTHKNIPSTANIMMLATISYWIIQIPAFVYHNDSDHGSYHESPFALIGFLVTLVAFCAYCLYQYKSAQAEEIERLQQTAARKKEWQEALFKQLSSHKALEQWQLQVFERHDKDKSGFLEAGELAKALDELGFKVERRDLKDILHKMDKDDKDGKISLAEFKAAVSLWVEEGRGTTLHSSKTKAVLANLRASQQNLHTAETKTSDVVSVSVNSEVAPLKGADASTYGAVKKEDEDDEDEEDCEEEEEQFWELTEGQLIGKALIVLAIGTAIVSVFSDPMVEVINNLGQRLGVSPFYISFVVTPIGSNASEVISGLIFAKKKTNEGISLTFASLHGAATMNHTLSLCIFMALVRFRGLAWNFSAEVLCTVVVTSIVGYFGRKQTVFMWQAVIVGLLYPFSIFFVWFLETVCGLD